MLPEKVSKYKFGIVNSESFNINRTHCDWYYKIDKIKYYFDSYGKQIDKQIKKIVKYLWKRDTFFNNNQVQDYNDTPVIDLYVFMS